MSRLLVVAALLVGSFTFAAGEARAQDRLPIQEARVSFLANDVTAIGVSSLNTKLNTNDDAVPAPVEPVKPVFDANRNKTLLPFYASTAVMQVLDVHSTLQVLRAGGGEGNPMLQGVVNNHFAFVAAKSAIAASTIFAASRIAKHSKVGAIVTLVAINSAYAMVVQHNYKLAHQMR